jgi:hypothetical protein
MIKVDLPNVITIGLSAMLAYGVLIGGVKIWQMVKGTTS